MKEFIVWFNRDGEEDFTFKKGADLENAVMSVLMDGLEVIEAHEVDLEDDRYLAYC